MAWEILWEHRPWCCSHIPGSGLFSLVNRHLVGLVYLSIQHRGFSGNTGAVQVVRMSLSYLSCVGLLSLMQPLESKHSVWKSHAREANFHGNVRSQGGDKALTCPGEHQRMKWANTWLCNILERAGIVAKYCCGVTYSSSQCLWKSEFVIPKGFCAVLGRQGLCEDGSNESKASSNVVWYNL